jgi:hypothetical protein
MVYKEKWELSFEIIIKIKIDISIRKLFFIKKRKTKK